MREQRSDDIVQSLTEYLRENPKNAKEFYNLGVAYGRAGLREKETEAYNSALAINPLYAEAWFNLGCCHLDAGSAENAVSAFEQATKLAPGTAEGFFMLGSAYGAMGLAEKLIETTQMGLRLQPNSAPALFNIGPCNRLNRFEEAKENLSHLRSLSPSLADQLEAFMESEEESLDVPEVATVVAAHQSATGDAGEALSILVSACDSLIRDQNDFWIVAGLTDLSFETAGSHKFRRAIKSFAEAGLDPELVSSLLTGVNGHLAELVGRDPRVTHMEANKGKSTRPDLNFQTPAANIQAEIKVVFDVTIPGFYGHKGHGVADDRIKLQECRKKHFVGPLYQVVFFLQMPSFDYPPGAWYAPSWKRCEVSRHQWPGMRGIAAQYAYLRKFLPDAPFWPAGGPVGVKLKSPSPSVLGIIDRRFQQNFRPDDGAWTFSTSHLKDAAVAYAIWAY